MHLEVIIILSDRSIWTFQAKRQTYGTSLLFPI